MSVSRSLKFTVLSTMALCLVGAFQGKSEAAIDCFECHDRAAFNKRVSHDPAAGGDCLSCHNPHVSRFAALLQHEVKDLCYSCHVDAEEEQNQGIVHRPVREGKCLDCHDPHASEVRGLLTAKSSEVCFSCHEELPKTFKNTHDPYAAGECDSCHRPHQSSNPNLLVQEPTALCLECHSKKTVRQAHPGFPTEPSNCVSCHNPHGSERPGLVRNSLHAPYEEGCDSCHSGSDPIRIDTCLMCHPEVSEQMASSHNHLVRFEDNGCLACHSPHAGDDDRLLKGKERYVCGTCHEATFERQEATKHKHELTGACNDCHAPHGSNHPAMAKAPINDVCSSCHGDHGFFNHPIGETVFDPRTGQMMTCASCHASKGTDHDYHTRFNRKKDLCVQCHSTY